MGILQGRGLLGSLVVSVILALSPFSSSAFAQEPHGAVAARNEPAAAFVIGGFDFTRGGDGGSIQYGSFFDQARASIALNLPAASFVSFPTLTSTTLAGVDVIVLTSAFHNYGAVSPLSAAEQAALLEYVKSGGCAILLTDNDSFAGTPASGASNQSLVGPFGVTTAGTIPKQVTATVADPSTSLVTDGSYGLISKFTQNYPGYFTDDGAYAERLANNSAGGALNLIREDAMQTGSGPVIFFSDANAFWDDHDLGYFTEDENLFMNSIRYCYAGGSALYTISGRVTDGKGNGIAGVRVSALSSGWATTDAQGNYTISALPAGSYTLEPSRMYFEFSPAQLTMDLLPPGASGKDFTATALDVVFLSFVLRP